MKEDGNGTTPSWLEDRFIVVLNIADLLSLCALVSALTALVCCMSGKFDFAIAALFVAAAFDFMDGPVARELKITRDFGRYLDSFVDTVIYLLTPAVFLYSRGWNEPGYLAVLLLLISSGFVRLSVFNQVGNVRSAAGAPAYLGMPVFWVIPALALAQAASWRVPFDTLSLVLAPVLAVFAFFMVRRTHFMKLTRWRLTCVIAVLLAAAFVWKGGVSAPSPKAAAATLDLVTSKPSTEGTRG